MEVTNQQIQDIQDELERALSMEHKITGHRHPFELDSSSYARWSYWNGHVEQARQILTILGL